jgi:hypothetical protein
MNRIEKDIFKGIFGAAEPLRSSQVEMPGARGEISELAGRSGSTDRLSSSPHSNQLTVFEFPSVRLHSQYGYITFGEWCWQEIARISAGGNRSAELIHGDGINAGRVAIVVGGNLGVAAATPYQKRI